MTSLWTALAGLALAPVLGLLARRLQHTDAPWPKSRWVGLAVGSAAGGAAVGTIHPWPVAAVYAAALAVAITAAAVDATEMRLPDALTYPLAIGGFTALMAVTLATGIGSPLRAIAGAAIYGGWMLFGALATHHGYGLGDIKLATGLGALLAWHSWLALAMGIGSAQLVEVVLVGSAAVRGRQRQALGLAFVVGVLAALIGPSAY